MDLLRAGRLGDSGYWGSTSGGGLGEAQKEGMFIMSLCTRYDTTPLIAHMHKGVRYCNSEARRLECVIVQPTKTKAKNNQRSKNPKTKKGEKDMPGKIKVSIGSLTEQLRVSAVPAGTTLNAFLEKSNKSYSSSVRLNGKSARKGTKLKNGDIVTLINSVSGGR